MPYLGLDLGTTHVKTAVISREGEVLGRGSAPVSLHYVGTEGVEQEFEEIWSATLSALRGAVAAAPNCPIEALGVSSQGGAMQLMDAHQVPLGPVISWLDGRGKSFDDALTRTHGPEWFADRIGHSGSGFAIGQLRRWHQQAWARTTSAVRVAFVGDATVQRLCGRLAHDATSAGLTLLFNPRLGTYDPEVLDLAKIQSTQLPDLIPVRQPAGGLTAAVARLSGLPSGIPVSAAVHDQYAAALGTGVIQPGQIMMGSGTAWVLLAVSEELPPPATTEALRCCHPVGRSFGQILSLRNGGSAFAWAKRVLGLSALETSSLDARMEEVAAGSQGVRFRPLLAPGTPAGLPEGTAGAWTGLKLVHTPAHLMRAVVEGLNYELNRHLDFLRRDGFHPDTLVLSGGAAHSRITPRIMADVTRVPVVCAREADASVLGAAIVARAIVEPHCSWPELVRDMVAPGNRIEPSAAAEFYQEAYRQYGPSLEIGPPN